jgi:hypothetical protein
MKMIYGGVPVNSLKVRHYEIDTNSATVQPSDLQAGVTCFARGQKVTGTGKSFEFANYGQYTTNSSKYVPTNINIVEVASSEYPIKLNMNLSLMKDTDFSQEQNIATVIIDGKEYDLVISVKSNIMKVVCDKTVQLQIFYGKDNYI